MPVIPVPKHCWVFRHSFLLTGFFDIVRFAIFAFPGRGVEIGKEAGDVYLSLIYCVNISIS